MLQVNYKAASTSFLPLLQIVKHADRTGIHALPLRRSLLKTVREGLERSLVKEVY